MELHKLEEIFNSSYSNSGNVDEAITLLKVQGASLMTTVKVVRKELKVSLKEADKIVLNSTAFGAKKEGIENFRNDFWDVVEKTKNEKSGTDPQD